MRIFAALILLLLANAAALAQDMYCVKAREFIRTDGNTEVIERDKQKGEISLCFQDGSFTVAVNGSVVILKITGHAHVESQSQKGYMEDRIECGDKYSVIITYSQPGVVHIVGTSSKPLATYGYTFTTDQLPVIRTGDERVLQQTPAK